MYKIGVDIGATKINTGIFDAESKCLLSSRKSYLKDIEDTAQFIKNEVDALCRECKISHGDILSCGVGIPGTVSADGKRAIKVPNTNLIREDIALLLEEKLGVPVTLVQDSRAAAWGEYLCGGGVGAETLVCVTLGTGIGTGIVIGGRIYNGALGCAGELGHLPVSNGSRKCGCGKVGCLEKYCAGGGLDITAEELLGEGKRAADLFSECERGNNAARVRIEEAVRALGDGLISIINLLSPDCLLFSGGLSAQEKLYLNPLIEYIKSRCYSAGKLPKISRAALGENSPLYGAAFVPLSKKRSAELSASIMCADILNMQKALSEIEESGIKYLHCDIMDNHFVPNLMLAPEFLNKLRGATSLPYDYHIMAQNPESIIEKLDIRRGDLISVHYESTPHIQRVVSMIKERGAKASVALNPSTPVSVLEEILAELDMVLIMSVNPGFAGQKIVSGSFEKISKMRKMIDEKQLGKLMIEVDGNCSFENAPKMYNAGADVLVVGTSSVFKPNMKIKDGVAKLNECLKECGA